ncbi:MAG: hypothetical protein ACLPQ6_04915 [Steroidobacteraceae bacterium]
MNEIELIRRQLATERAHALEVIRACVATLAASAARGTAEHAQLAAFRQAARDYLGRALSSFARRDQRLGELARRLPAGDSRRRAIEAALVGSGASRDALAKLDTESWRELADCLRGAGGGRQEMLDELLAANGPVSAWREFAGIDADSVLAERAGFARLQAALPAGVTLAAATT